MLCVSFGDLRVIDSQITGFVDLSIHHGTTVFVIIQLLLLTVNSHYAHDHKAYLLTLIHHIDYSRIHTVFLCNEGLLATFQVGLLSVFSLNKVD